MHETACFAGNPDYELDPAGGKGGLCIFTFDDVNRPCRGLFLHANRVHRNPFLPVLLQANSKQLFLDSGDDPRYHELATIGVLVNTRPWSQCTYYVHQSNWAV